MVLVAALIAMEKTLPWRRAATYGVTVVLVVLAVLVIVAPDVISGVTMPMQRPMR